MVAVHPTRGTRTVPAAARHAPAQCPGPCWCAGRAPCAVREPRVRGRPRLSPPAGTVLTQAACPQGVSLQELVSRLARPFKDYELWALCHACLRALHTHRQHPGDVPRLLAQPVWAGGAAASIPWTGVPRGCLLWTWARGVRGQWGAEAYDAGLTAGDPASPLLVRRRCPQAGEVWLGTLDVTLPRGPQNPAAPEGVWPASSPDVARHGPGGHSRRPAPPLALLSPSQREAALRVPPSPRAACLGLGGGGQASALAPVPCRRWAGVLASPGDVVASGGQGPPARPRPLRPRGVWPTPTPTSSPTAAVLCLDSVLVAKDGAVRFGPPPAYGGSAGMGATPRVAVWHGRPTAGQLSGFGIPSQVLTARSSWPPRSQSRSWPQRRYWTPVIPPPARGAPTLPREPEGAGGGAWAPGRRGGPQGQRLCPDPALSGLGCVPQHGWLWLCHPRTGLRCGQLRAVRAGWPEPSGTRTRARWARLSRAACGKMACIRAQEQVPSGKAEGTGCPSSPWPTQHIETPAWGQARTGQHSGRPALSSCGSGDVCEEGRHSPRQEPGRRRRGAALLGQGQRGPGVRHPAVAGRPTPGVSGGGWEADRPPSAVRRSWSGLEGPSGAWTSARRRPLFLRRGVVGHQLDPESRCDRPRVLQELPAAPRTGRKGPGQRRRRPRPRGERHRLRPVHRAPTPEPQEQSEGSPGSGGRGSGVRGAAALRDSAAPARRGNPPAARKPPENVSGATAPPASPHTAASTPVLQGPRQGCPPVLRSRPRPDGHSRRLGEPRRAQPPEAGGRRCSEPAHPGGVSVCSRGPRWRGRKQRPAAEASRPRAASRPPRPGGRGRVPSGGSFGAVYARARHHAVGTRPPRPRAQRAQPGDGQVH